MEAAGNTGVQLTTNHSVPTGPAEKRTRGHKGVGFGLEDVSRPCLQLPQQTRAVLSSRTFRSAGAGSVLTPALFVQRPPRGENGPEDQ